MITQQVSLQMWFIRPPGYTSAKSSQSVSGWWIARVINTEKERDLLSVVELRCFSAPWTSCFKITGDRVSVGKGLHFYWKPTTFKWPESWRTIKLSNSPIIKSFIWQIFHCRGNSCVFPPLSQEIKPLTYANCWQGMETNGLLNTNRDTPAPFRGLMDGRAIHKSRATRTEWRLQDCSLGSELRQMSLLLEGLSVGGIKGQEEVFCWYSFLLLRHKLPQGRGLQHLHVLSHGLCGSGIQKQFGWVLCLRSQEAAVWRLPWRRVHVPIGVVWAAFSPIPQCCSLLPPPSHPAIVQRPPQLLTMQFLATWTSPTATESSRKKRLWWVCQQDGVLRNGASYGSPSPWSSSVG